jgi:peptide/nickel transport system substrate-binding protein
MMPREIKEQYGDFKTVAVGTGPYQLKEFTPRQRMVMERTPNWRDKGRDGQSLPYIDRIEVPVLADYAAEVAALRSGQLDLNVINGFLKRDAVSVIAAMPKLKLYKDVLPIPRGMWFNFAEKPFDDIRVRRAIFYATDHEEIVELGYQGGAVRTGHIPLPTTHGQWRR